MSTVSVARPPPTQAQCAQLRVLASRVHYAFTTRPPLESPIRPDWDQRFLDDVIPLLNMLYSAKFVFVPSIAMGCVWANNCRFIQTPPREALDINAIGPVVPGHPALEKHIPPGMRRLKYTAMDHGPQGLLPEEELDGRWWLDYRSAAQPPKSSSIATSKEQPDHGGLVTHPQAKEPPLVGSRTPSSPPAVQLSEEDVADDSMMSVDPEMPPTPHDVPPPLNLSVEAALAQVREEMIPQEWLEHPRPCRRCATTGIPCFIYPTTSSVCGYCARRKQKCSLTFTVTNQTVAGFLAWAYFVMVSRPDEFGEPALSPPEAPSCISEAPAWFQRQCVSTQDRPEYPAGAKPSKGPISLDTRQESHNSDGESSDTPLELAPSTKSSKGKSVSRRAIAQTSRAPSIAPPPTEDRGRPETRSSRVSTRSSSSKIIHAQSLPRPSPSSANVSPSPSAVAPRGSLPKAGLQASTPSIDNPPSHASRPQRSSTRAEAPRSFASSSLPIQPSGSSKVAAIDVDAMDLDTSPPRERRPAPAQRIDHIGVPITVRGSEFDDASIADPATLGSSQSRSQSPGEVRAATVPPVVGSWRDLPRFNHPSLESVGGPSHFGVKLADMHLSTPPTLSSLPDIASTGNEAMPTTEQLRSIVDTMTTAYQSTRESAVSLHRQAMRIKSRIATAQANAVGRPTAEAFALWVPETRSLADDLQSIAKQLASTENWISIISRSLRDYLSAPLDGDTMATMLSEVCKVKDAYRDASVLFAELQEDVRPLRREIYLLRGRADSAEAVAEAAATEAAFAIEPLLTNLHKLVSAEIQAAQLSVLGPMERLADTIASHGALPPEVLGDIVQGIRAALAEMWRSASGIQRYIDDLWEKASAAFEARVHALEVLIGRMEGSHVPSTSSTSADSVGPMQRLHVAIDALTARVQTLELQAARREEIDARVLDVLARIGLTSDVLRRIAAT